MKWICSAACALMVAPAIADVRLPGIFSDHMVLQRDAAVPVWGWADAGEAITIKAGTAIATATADPNGKWVAKLNSLPASSEPITITVSGKNTIELKDVLVGDVWVCGGQSNMGWSLSAVQNANDVVPKADDLQLRFYIMEARMAFDPVDDCKGRWTICTPATAQLFPAIGYFLGRDLREHLKVPVGLVAVSMGGSSSQAWTSREALDANPALKPMMDAFRRDEAALREKTSVYETQTVPQWREADKVWRRDVLPEYQKQLKAWDQAVVQAKAAGVPAPAKPLANPPRPQLPAPPNRMTPTLLYNGMIAPLAPFAVKGVAWCQGEHNTFDPKLYAVLLPTMISDWRQRWSQPNLPFVYVQVAHNAPKENGGLNFGKWPLVREVQMKLADPNTAMVVAVDVGDPKDVHYRNKQPVGQRMALAARHVAYGESLAWSGPIFDRVEFASGQAVIRFRFADRGLVAGKPPTDSPFATAAAVPLTGFEIAGADQRFVPADATIQGSTVIVKSSQVPSPVAVRYGWSDAPLVNLYNSEGLPASPFRTDDREK